METLGDYKVEVDKVKVQHTATNPNHFSVINKGSKWLLKEDESVWQVKDILTEEPRVKLIEVVGDREKILEPIKLLDRQTWNYYGEDQ